MKAYIAVPVTLAIIYRAISRKTLTPLGAATAGLTAAAHAVHPWSLPFALLFVFFIAGTRVTKIKHDVKATLTMQSTGIAEAGRTHIQVLANSGVASVLTVLHAYQLSQRSKRLVPTSGSEGCFPWGGDLLVVGIVANYAAVAADTFSSELGILAKSRPRLITSWKLRQVPPGTNGGVTLFGLGAGVLGSLIVVATSMALIPFCPPGSSISGGAWTSLQKGQFAIAMVLCGAFGSVLDSFLGGWLQRSVRDTRTGRIIEGEGGKSVLVSRSGPRSMHFQKRAEVKEKILSGEGQAAIEEEKTAQLNAVNKKIVGNENHNFADDKPSRVVESGSLDLLDNNEVNFLMALTISLGAMGVASWIWDVPLASIIPL